MFERALPGSSRSLMGIATVVMLAAVTHAIGAAEVPEEKPRIYLDIKVVATDEQAKAVFLKTARYITHPGEAIPPLRDGQHELSCTANLKSDPAGDFRKLQIPVSCIYRAGGKVLSGPTITITDGYTGMIEAGVQSGASSFSAVLSASLSEGRLNEAGKLPVPRAHSAVIQNLLSGL